MEFSEEAVNSFRASLASSGAAASQDYLAAIGRSPKSPSAGDAGGGSPLSQTPLSPAADGAAGDDAATSRTSHRSPSSSPAAAAAAGKDGAAAGFPAQAANLSVAEPLAPVTDASDASTAESPGKSPSPGVSLPAAKLAAAVPGTTAAAAAAPDDGASDSSSEAASVAAEDEISVPSEQEEEGDGLPLPPAPEKASSPRVPALPRAVSIETPEVRRSSGLAHFRGVIVLVALLAWRWPGFATSSSLHCLPKPSVRTDPELRLPPTVVRPYDACCCILNLSCRAACRALQDVEEPDDGLPPTPLVSSSVDSILVHQSCMLPCTEALLFVF